MDELLAGLKAIAETTRVRILFVLSHGELNVSEMTYVLGQSQPRVSRHIRILDEAGIAPISALPRLPRVQADGSTTRFVTASGPPMRALC